MTDKKQATDHHPGAKPTRKALEDWINNLNLWCHDPDQTGWQSKDENDKT